MQKLPYILLGGGFIVCAVSAILGWILAPIWINNGLIQEAKLSKLSSNVSSMSRLINIQDESEIETLQKTWKEWVGEEPPFDFYLNIYLFNITNPEAIKNGAKPILHEVGPFVYRQQRSKINIKETELNDTIVYNETRRYYFVPELSNAKEDDLVTIVNVPFVGLAREISKLSKWIRYAVTTYLDDFHEEVFITKTANEFLFGGYYQAMVASLSKLTNTEYLPNNTFGMYYGRNGSDFWNYEIYSGLRDMSKFSEITKWDRKNELEWWDNKECNKIEGTDGLSFPPYITKETVLKILVPDGCRVMPLEFSKVVDYNGVEAFRFVITEKPYQDSRKNPDNMCFCTQHSGDREECPTDGAYQISACRRDAPVYVSLPHFLFGPHYAGQSEGFHPDPDKHQTFIEIEPITGTVLKARFRDQVSVQLEPYNFNNGLKKVPRILMPFIWKEDSATITPEAAAKLYSITSTPTSIATVSSSVGVGVGILLILLAFLVFILRARKRTPSLH